MRCRYDLGRSMGRHRQFVRSTLCELLRRIVLFLFRRRKGRQQLSGALRALPNTSPNFSLSFSRNIKIRHCLTFVSLFFRDPTQALPTKHRLGAKLRQTDSLRCSLFVLALFERHNIGLVTQPSSAHFEGIVKLLFSLSHETSSFYISS